MQTNLTGKYPRLRSNCGKSLSMKQRVNWRALSGRKLKKIMLSFALIFATGSPFSVITHGSVSVMGLMNDKEKRVQLLIDEDVLNSEYVGCHPCINTSSVCHQGCQHQCHRV